MARHAGLRPDIRSLADLRRDGGEADTPGGVEQPQMFDVWLAADGGHDLVGGFAAIVQHVEFDAAGDGVADNGGAALRLFEQVTPLTAKHEREKQAERQDAAKRDRGSEPYAQPVPQLDAGHTPTFW